jgi:zinc protease
MTDRRTPPETSIITHLPFLYPIKRKLGNGVPVYLVEGGTEDIVRVELIFLSGSYHQHKPLVTYAAANLLKSGTFGKTSHQISEILDFYGTFLQIDAQKDIVSVSVFVLKKYLEPVLELLQEIIKQPSYPQHELDILLKNQKHQHIVNSRKVSYLARVHFGEQLFGSGHPYGYRLRKNDFDKIIREDLLVFHQQWIHPGNLNILVSGKLPENMAELLEQNFGDSYWKRPKEQPPEPLYAVHSDGQKKLLIQKDEALQSAIRMGKRIINRSHPDYHRLIIANALLGGFFGSRLMKNVRQDKGFTYGINSALVSLVREGYFFVGTQVGVDVCQPAIEQIYHEIKQLRTEAATSIELQTLKNYLSGNFLRSFDGPFAQAERFKEMLVFNLDATYFDNFLVELKNTTTRSIMETASQYLHEESMIEVVAGKCQAFQ